jgi:hypothetical protein
VLGLSAKKCGTDEVLFAEQVQAERKEEVIDALSRMAGRFRALAGKSPEAFRPTSAPLRDGTTSSLEALRAYSAGYAAISFSDHAGLECAAGCTRLPALLIRGGLFACWGCGKAVKWQFRSASIIELRADAILTSQIG